ncbi:IucA/IucC family protein [Streptomyces sp. RFCAC02]|uniref:IucA/IucC family protein n=1 Tax=Streptomyces sp. RFCAC02 TaxID=2499143 RepID=UPI00102125E2|nr:IucA/IucC family protein [Streptomyces sp. RFCAC02]
MNARSRPDHAPGRARGPVAPAGPARAGEPVVPRQGGHAAPSGAGTGPVRSWPLGADPLEHPDPALAADAATVDSLLRCWVRETAVPRPAGDVLRLPLRASGTVLRVPVRHWSAAGLHRFGPAVPEGAAPGAAPLDAVTLAALLAREAAHGPGGAPDGSAPAGGTDAPVTEATDLVGRVADSVRRTAVFLTDRRAAPGPAAHGDAFLEAEQSVLLGHPLHPTPKSREGLAGDDARRCSPELRGSFRLHWFAVHRSVLASDSAWTERGAPVAAETLALRLADHGPADDLPAGTVPLPLHPWQAREIVHRPAVAALLSAGLLHDLGESGPHWYPTSSVRTVHRPGAPAMLKLSLALRITNSRRENLRKELLRGVEVHRLLRSGLGAQWRAAFPGGPGFDIVRDPAWLAVDDTDGRPLTGLDTVVRHNPFAPGDDVSCLAALTALRPWPGAPETHLRSRLARIVDALAERTGRGRRAVAVEWLLRYLHAVVRPLLWLDAHAGVALEAHQQNTLVILDAQGWPAGGRYRDNQGYYFRASRRAELRRRLPGLGERSDTFVADAVADERFAYYVGINNVFGLIGAMGAERLADEELLFAAFRGFLRAAASDGDGPSSPLVGHLLESRTLRCKANLLTRLHGLDELVGPVDGQSRYVAVANPLAAR